MENVCLRSLPRRANVIKRLLEIYVRLTNKSDYMSILTVVVIVILVTTTAVFIIIMDVGRTCIRDEDKHF